MQWSEPRFTAVQECWPANPQRLPALRLESADTYGQNGRPYGFTRISRRSQPVISDQRCEGGVTGVIELPSENVQRWTALRKAAVVNAIDAGELTREEICRRYQISLEELLSWERAYESRGVLGLHSTRLQVNRRLVARGRDRRRCRSQELAVD